MRKKRANLHTTVDAELMQKIRELAVNQGTTKYGKFIEEGMELVLKKYEMIEDEKENS